MNEQNTMTEQTVSTMPFAPTMPTAPAAPVMPIVPPATPDEQPFDKEAWAAKKKEQREALYEMADGTTELACDDFATMKEYLAVQARFDRYSVTNAMLVAAQCPTATRLGDFDYWHKQGASVVHGAKAISIFEPGPAYNRSDGNVGHSFNIKRVFDISQTTAAPYLTQQGPDYRRIIKGLIETSPVKVQPTETMPDARNVVYDVKNSVILARTGQPWEQLCKGLMENIALANLARQREKPVNYNFAARAVAFMVYQRYGIPNKGVSDDYKPKQYVNMEPKEVRAQLDIIRHVAHEMTLQLSRAMKPMQKEAPKEEAR